MTHPLFAAIAAADTAIMSLFSMTVHIQHYTVICVQLLFLMDSMYNRANLSALSAVQVNPQATTSTLRFVSTRYVRILWIM